MIFLTDDANLALVFALEPDEAPAVDLTDGTGEKILSAAVDGMIDAIRREQAPDGTPWPELAGSTERDRRRRGQAGGQIGYRTGALLGGLDAGDLDIEPRRAVWSYPRGRRWGAMHGFHNGNDRNRQPARPVIGWTAGAREEAQRVVNGGG